MKLRALEPISIITSECNAPFQSTNGGKRVIPRTIFFLLAFAVPHPFSVCTFAHFPTDSSLILFKSAVEQDT